MCEIDQSDNMGIKVECSPLKCLDCQLRLEVVDLERDRILDSRTYFGPGPVYFEYVVEESFCGVYQLRANISRGNQQDAVNLIEHKRMLWEHLKIIKLYLFKFNNS